MHNGQERQEQEQREQAKFNIRKAVRLLMKEDFPYSLEGYKARPEVMFAKGDANFTNTEFDLTVMPPLDHSTFAWEEEYSNKKYWSTEEAATLAVGLDPLAYKSQLNAINNDYRIDRENAITKINEAIVNNELNAKRHNDIDYLDPITFCRWAYESGLLKSQTTSTQLLVSIATAGTQKPSEYYLQEFKKCAMSYASGKPVKAAYRKEMLAGFAIYTKIENPLTNIPDITNRALNALDESHRELPGFNYDAIRNDLYTKIEIVIPKSHDKEEGFLKSTLSKMELENQELLQKWWNKWRPHISKAYSRIDFPEYLNVDDISTEILEVTNMSIIGYSVVVDIDTEKCNLHPNEIRILEHQISDGDIRVTRSSQPEENHGKDTRPDAPLVQAPRTKSRVMLAAQRGIEWVAGLLNAVFRSKKFSNRKCKP